MCTLSVSGRLLLSTFLLKSNIGWSIVCTFVIHVICLLLLIADIIIKQPNTILDADLLDTYMYN